MADKHAPGLNEGTADQRRRWLSQFWGSTIGKKMVVATTGAIMGLYVIAHMLGNLKGFQGNGDGGTAPIDTYGAWLRTLGEPALPYSGALWIVRAVLVGALVLHVVAIVQLSKRNQLAKPKHHQPPRIQRSLASRTMLWGGLLLLAFIVVHILQFTTLTLEVTPLTEGAVYANLYSVFQEWYFVVFYVLAMAFLLLHLRHGIWSVMQTMGWDKPNRNRTFRRTASVIAVAVSVGFALVPVGFWLGVAPAPTPENATASAEVP